jgi:hypothetical protein
VSTDVIDLIAGALFHCSGQGNWESTNPALVAGET